MEKYFHSVRLDEDKCKGCINCIKRCPTEAIRVRNGKASIISERCIDCGECIRICPHHAKRSETDRFNSILEYKYKIALPAPSLYGQFNNLDNVGYVLSAFKMMGFDDVFEVSAGAEFISEATREIMNSDKLPKPVISSACPAVVRLIRVRFPKLIPHILPLVSPMEQAAATARKQAAGKTGFAEEDIGIFFITPCPAKITAIKDPLVMKSSNVNGAFAIKDIYPPLLQIMNKTEEPDAVSNSGIIGVSWASSGGEASALIREHYLAADGIENIINVLEQLEDEKLDDLDFIELNACPGGCVGGPLTVENPYVANARIHRLRKYLPVSCNHMKEKDEIDRMYWNGKLEEVSVLKLADNVVEAMTRLNDLNDIHNRLPGLDCGVCGAPSCRALAEDIVRGNAKESDCVFLMREKVEQEGMAKFIPAPFRKGRK